MVLKTGNEEFLVIGVDIGGSHITAAQVDLRAKTILEKSRRRTSINANGTVEGIIRGWAEVIRSTFGLLSPSSIKIAIALPGPCDYEKGICLMNGNYKFGALYGKNVKDLLAKELKIQSGQILLQNDAGAFLTGEFFPVPLLGTRGQSELRLAQAWAPLQALMGQDVMPTCGACPLKRASQKI